MLIRPLVHLREWIVLANASLLPLHLLVITLHSIGSVEVVDELLAHSDFKLWLLGVYLFSPVLQLDV